MLIIVKINSRFCIDRVPKLSPCLEAFQGKFTGEELPCPMPGNRDVSDNIDNTFVSEHESVGADLRVVSLTQQRMTGGSRLFTAFFTHVKDNT